MSLRKWVGMVTAFATAGVLVHAMGCSSSTAPVQGGDSGHADGASGDTGVLDTGLVLDSGAADGAQDAPGDGPRDAKVDAPLMCPPASTASFVPVTYATTVPTPGVCSSAATAAFVFACGINSTKAFCQTWIDANVMTDAGPGNACGNCIIAPMNNGGTWVDPNGLRQPNYAGCVQLLDAAHGADCSGAYNNAVACESVACDSCPGTTADYFACATAADNGSCSTYASMREATCASDIAPGGTFSMCQPGAATGNSNLDLTYIIGLVCGGGSGDAGTSDSSASDSGAIDTGSSDAGASDAGMGESG